VTAQLSTFDEFRTRLAGIFEVPAELLNWETRFLEDLAFDSLRMLQLAMTFEDLDLEMPAEMAWEIQTVGDAYAYYVGAVGAADATSTAAPRPPGS
jgi:acyl carrier protein